MTDQLTWPKFDYQKSKQNFVETVSPVSLRKERYGRILLIDLESVVCKKLTWKLKQTFLSDSEFILLLKMTCHQPESPWSSNEAVSFRFFKYELNFSRIWNNTNTSSPWRLVTDKRRLNLKNIFHCPSLHSQNQRMSNCHY